MSYQTTSKRSPPFCRKTQTFSGTNQKPERRRQFGTGLVRHCPQGLFSLSFSFLFFVPYFPACLDFPSPSLSAPGSPRMITVYQGFDIIYSFHGTALDRGTLSLTFDLCFCKVKIFRCYIYLVFASVATQCRIQIFR